jgi:hypothetical protein
MTLSRKHGGHRTGWKIENILKYLKARLRKTLESFCMRKMANSGLSGKECPQGKTISRKTHTSCDMEKIYIL